MAIYLKKCLGINGIRDYYWWWLQFDSKLVQMGVLQEPRIVPKPVLHYNKQQLWLSLDWQEKSENQSL
jgi:hypothetical protein